MNRHLAQALGAMALGALLWQPVTAMADPPAHARNENSAKHRGYSGYQGRGGDDRGQYGRGDYDRGRGDWDDRYDGRRYGDGDRHHRHGAYYYPRPGYVVHHLPPRPRVVHHHGHPYYYAGGTWYRPYGPSFVVVAPPVGLVLSFLPEFQTTLYVGGFPYYQAGPVYYAWHPKKHGYVVTNGPY
jgi:hypothetical protein